GLHVDADRDLANVQPRLKTLRAHQALLDGKLRRGGRRDRVGSREGRPGEPGREHEQQRRQPGSHSAPPARAGRRAIAGSGSGERWPPGQLPARTPRMSSVAPAQIQPTSGLTKTVKVAWSAAPGSRTT